MEYQRISVRALILWELYAFLLYGGAFALIFFLLVPFTWLWQIIFWAITATFLFFAIVYFPLLYATSRYALTDESVIWESGVITHRRRMVLRKQIVLVERIRNPVAMLLGVSVVRISATGADISLHYLGNKKARQLLEELQPAQKREGAD